MYFVKTNPSEKKNQLQKFVFFNKKFHLAKKQVWYKLVDKTLKKYK